MTSRDRRRLGAWALSLLAACSTKSAEPSQPSARPDDGGTVLDSAAGEGMVTRDAAPSEAAPSDGDGVGDDDGSLLTRLAAHFPDSDATGVCADAPLRMAFSSPVALGSSGRIQLWHLSPGATPGETIAAAVDAIDIGAGAWTHAIGGRVFNLNRPVVVEGQEAFVSWKPQAMVPGETYVVTIDSGVFVDPAQQSLGRIAGRRAWRFTTSARAPASPGALSVAGDGSGDFCTVQGAIDAIPAANTTPVTVTVKSGTYREIVFIAQKSNVTLRGEDRHQTVIAYANNNALNPHTNTRAMVEAEGSNGLVIENLTLHNLTPGGSQAEALRVEPGDRVILRDADFISTQDTLLLSGRVYVSNSYVEGNVDFIWGKGAAYFDRCELKTVGRAGYEVQARNAALTYGYVFVDSTLTSTPGLTGNFLGRIDVSVYPASQVAYIDCKMDKHIDPKGWLVTGAGVDGGTTSALRFSEYRSTDLAGQPLDVSIRIPDSRQLSDAEAALMRDRAVVLAGWDPLSSPP